MRNTHVYICEYYIQRLNVMCIATRLARDFSYSIIPEQAHKSAHSFTTMHACEQFHICWAISLKIILTITVAITILIPYGGNLPSTVTSPEASHNIANFGVRLYRLKLSYVIYRNLTKEGPWAVHLILGHDWGMGQYSRYQYCFYMRKSTQVSYPRWLHNFNSSRGYYWFQPYSSTVTNPEQGRMRYFTMYRWVQLYLVGVAMIASHVCSLICAETLHKAS